MELSPKQQTTSLIQKAQRILLLTHYKPDGDAVGSLLGFYLVLKKLKKDVQVVVADHIPPTYSFLPFHDAIKNGISGLREFIVNINCKDCQVDKLGYKLEGDSLKIVIMPKEGNFKKEDLSVNYGSFHFDLIIVLDTPDLERLGHFYEENPDLFYQAPTINIDHHPTNSYFAKVNLVDLTATSTSEILISLIEALEEGENLLNEHVATCLLTGIISDTNSFQNVNTTPKSLTCAAQLIAAGANQQEIVKNLFQTKSLSTLKLWGRILTKLKYEPELRFSYSEVLREDLKEVGAKEEEVQGVIDGLLKSSSSSDLVLLLSEREGGVAGSLRAINKAIDCTEIARLFKGGGHKAAAAFIIPDKKLKDVKEKILETIREYQRRRVRIA